MGLNRNNQFTLFNHTKSIHFSDRTTGGQHNHTHFLQ